MEVRLHPSCVGSLEEGVHLRVVDPKVRGFAVEAVTVFRAVSKEKPATLKVRSSTSGSESGGFRGKHFEGGGKIAGVAAPCGSVPFVADAGDGGVATISDEPDHYGDATPWTFHVEAGIV